jgi:hypothetical protein
MMGSLKRAIVALGLAVALAALWVVSATRPVMGQGSSTYPANYKAPRQASGAPDLNGFWQPVNTANWDIEEHGTAPSPFPQLEGAYFAQPGGFSVVEGGPLPYKPEGLAKRNKYRENRLKPDPILSENGRYDGSDPEAKCFGGGVPRGIYLGLPFQIIQTPTKILLAYEYAGVARTVHMDTPRSTLLDIESWNGQSVGSWDGDTLVVDVQWFSNEVWLDRAGNFYGRGTKVTERFTPASPYHLHYEATIEDPKVFTRPWKLSMPLYRRMEPQMQLHDFQCIPFGEEYHYKTLVKKPR